MNPNNPNEVPSTEPQQPPVTPVEPAAPGSVDAAPAPQVFPPTDQLSSIGPIAPPTVTQPGPMAPMMQPAPITAGSSSQSKIIFIALGVAALLVVLIIVGLLLVFKKDTATNSNTVAPQSSSTQGAAESTVTENKAAESVSSGDYTVTRPTDLSQVCTSQKYPQGVKGATGKKTVVLKAVTPESPRLILEQPSKLTPEYKITIDDIKTLSSADRVTCVTYTGKITFEEPCSASGTSFTNVGYEYKVVIHDIQNKKVLGETTVGSRKGCPSFAALRDNKNIASIDDAALSAAVMKY